MSPLKGVLVFGGGTEKAQYVPAHSEYEVITWFMSVNTFDDSMVSFSKMLVRVPVRKSEFRNSAYCGKDSIEKSDSSRKNDCRYLDLTAAPNGKHRYLARVDYSIARTAGYPPLHDTPEWKKAKEKKVFTIDV